MSSFHALIARLESVVAQYDSFMDVGQGESLKKWLDSTLNDFRIASDGRKGYANLATLNADLTQPDKTMAEVTNDGVVENNGVYRKAGAAGAGSWVKAPYDGYTVLENKVVELTQNLEDDLSYARANIDSLLSNDSEATQVFGAQNLPTKAGWIASVGITGFVYSFRLAKSDTVKRFRFLLDGVDLVDRFHVRIFSRDVASAYTDAPSSAQGDVLVDEFDYIPSGLPASASGQRITVDIERTLSVDSDQYYMIELTALDSMSAEIAFGSAANSFDAPSDKTLAGYYKNTGGWAVMLSSSAHFEVYADRIVNYADKIAYLEDVQSTIAAALGNNKVALASDVQNLLKKAGSWSASFLGWGVIREFNQDEFLYGLELFLNQRPPGAESISAIAQCKVWVYEGDNTLDRTNFERFPLIHQSSQGVSLAANDSSVIFNIGIKVRTGKRYIFIIEGFDGAGISCAFGGAQCSSDGLDVGLRSIYKSMSGSWGASAGANLLARTYGYSAYVNRALVDEVLDNFDMVEVIRAARNFRGRGWPALPAEFIAWAVGYTPTELVKVNGFRAYLDNVLDSGGVKFQVYQRLESVGDGQPGVVAGDIKLLEEIYSPVDLGAGDNALKQYVFDMSSVSELRPGYMYLFKVSAVAGFIGAGQGYADLDDTQAARRGYYGRAGWGSMAAISSNSSFAWELTGKQYQSKTLFTRSLLHPSISVETEIAGNTVSIPELKVASTGRSILTKDKSFVCRRPYSESKTISTDLVFDKNPSCYMNSNASMEHRYIRFVAVKNVDTQTPLVEGEDFDVFYDGGKIYGLKNVVSTAIEVTYAGYYSRYDLIECDPITGGLNYVEGTDRIYDPEEYLPSRTPGYIPLFHVYAYADQVQLIPLYNSNDGQLDGYENEYSRMRERNKKCLRSVLGKLTSGAPVKFVGYGDSITAQGGGVWQSPDGTTRDTSGYYYAFPDDTKATYELFDHGDGAGVVHQHNGWNWVLKSALESRFGSLVSYLNFGIGGTTSTDYVDPDGVRHGGLNPDRLNAMLATSPDLVVLAFGMNEIGAAASTVNVISIIESIKAIGSDVIVVGCPRINELGGRAALEKWSETNHRLWTAAQHTGSAYLSTEYYQGDQHLGYMGLSAHSFCNANVYNHPGRYELKKIGEALAGMFD